VLGTPGQDAPRERRSVRTDIQFLRALAVVSVIVYHVHESWLPGGFVGVDVFFVISGFLICGALARELATSGRVRLWAFYARRARRILPMSLVVIATTLVASVFVASPIRMLIWGQPWQESSIIKDGLASLMYVPNLWFAFQDSDYLAERAQSPFLHFWSLGVEEQFYVAAPLLLILAWYLARHHLKRFVAITAVVVLGSFVYGLWLTQTNPISAFYHPGSRAWELGIGAVAALAIQAGWQPPNSRYMVLLRWVAAIVLGAALLRGDFGLPWPGWIAGLPVLAAAALLWAGFGNNGARSGWWSWSVFQRLGDWSYSLYLWHWAALVLVALGLGRDMRIREAAVVIVAVVALSALSYRYVELPFRRRPVASASQRARIFGGAAAASLVVLAVAGLAGVLGGRLADVGISTEPPSAAASAMPPPTASSVRPTTTDFAQKLPSNLRPTLSDAKADQPEVYRDGCHLTTGQYVIPDNCVFGSGAGPVVAIMGDSHAAQWVEPLIRAAEAGEITLVSLTASNCAPYDLPRSEGVGRSRDDCLQWLDAAIGKVQEIRPDTLILSSSFYYGLLEGVDEPQAYRAGLAQTLQLVPDDTRIAFISDTPRMAEDPVECAAAHRNDLEACGRPRDNAIKPEIRAAIRELVEATGGEYFDPVPRMCSDTTCGIVLDSILVYRDSHHVTMTFSLRLDTFVRKAAGIS